MTTSVTVSHEKIRQYWRIKQDDELQFPPVRAAGLPSWPCVFRLEEYSKQALTPEWRAYWLWLNGNDENAFSTYSRKFMPVGSLATLVMGLNLLSGTETILFDRVGTIPRGTPCLKVRTMKEPDYSVTYQTDPDIIQIANYIFADKYAPNGLRMVLPFDDRGGRAHPVYFPVTSKADVLYPLANLEKLPLGTSIYPPYNPQ